MPTVLRIGALALACAVVYAGALAQSGDALVALVFVLGASSLALALWAGARGLTRLTRVVSRAHLPALTWQGFSRLSRPGAGSAGSVVALGLGTFVIVGLALLQGLMSEELDTLLPADAPNVFLLDVQPEQWPDVRRLFESAGAKRVTHTQLFSARLSHVANRPVQELVAERAGNPNARSAAHWVLTREQRVAVMQSLPADNRIVAGSLWSERGVNELSLELAFARALGAQIGTWLRLDVQGVPIDFKVTSLRTVNFRSFALNFYMLAEPGALAGAPHVVLAGVRIASHAEQRAQDKLAGLHPNVTMVRVASMIERAAGILRQAAFGVQLIGSFAILTGLVILANAISASQQQRARELALLRALGVDRATIIALLAVEYAVIGAVAGTLGAVVGYLLTTFLATHLLDLSAPPSWLVCCSGVLCVVAMSVLAGLAASARALRSRPLDVLRAPC
jgi:putative ABC transport system permease protein